MTGLPIILDVVDATCLVVGAGVAGRRKVAALQAAGARIVVIDPAHCDIESGRHLQRSWKPGDSKDMLITVIATDHPEVNEAAAADAHSHRSLVLRADKPDDGDFRLPAVHRTGQVTVTVDTNGTSPTLAGFLRDRVAQQTAHWARVAEWAADNRPVTSHLIDQQFQTLTEARKEQPK